MGDYVVSARKYRPRGFEDVVGQDHITTTLNNAISNKRLAQALLFCGPRGVGKTTCARIVARRINGYDEQTSNTLNIFELDAASNNSVDDIRSLTDQVRYPPQTGKYKVYIIDEVHMLSNAAFNAFLKTLEEPPTYAIFILATTEKHKVIPTILSRCQIFDFNRIQVSDIAKQLRKVAEDEGITVEDSVLYLIGQKADGALRDALSLFDRMVSFSNTKTITLEDVLKNLHILDHEYYFNIIDGLLEKNTATPLLILDEVIKKGFDGKHFIIGLSNHIRNLLVAQETQTATLIEATEKDKKKNITQSQRVPATVLLTWLELTHHCEIQYRESQNQRLTIELGLMKMNAASAVLASTHSAPREDKKKTLKTEPIAAVPQQTAKESYTTQEHIPSSDESVPEPNTQKTKMTPDLRHLIAPPPDVKPKESTDNRSVTPSGNSTTDTPLEALQKAWNEFAEQHKEKKIEHQILQQKIDYKDNTITLHLTNAVEDSFLQHIKPSLVSYLRSRLNNESITVISHLNSSEAPQIAYTNKEKFDTLVKEYPIIETLKTRLKLDIEY